MEVKKRRVANVNKPKFRDSLACGRQPQSHDCQEHQNEEIRGSVVRNIIDARSIDVIHYVPLVI